jgi:hypothetical protein
MSIVFRFESDMTMERYVLGKESECRTMTFHVVVAFGIAEGPCDRLQCIYLSCHPDMPLGYSQPSHAIVARETQPAVPKSLAWEVEWSTCKLRGRYTVVSGSSVVGVFGDLHRPVIVDLSVIRHELRK